MMIVRHHDAETVAPRAAAEPGGSRPAPTFPAPACPGVAPELSLGEGGTPLVPARIEFPCRVAWKLESANPTGSQKDRALAISITRAVELGFERVVIGSTGSAGLSCAAYCARAGLACVVVVPEGTPAERLRLMQAYGARIVEMQGTFHDIERLLDRARATGDWFDATTRRAANPFHVEGPKTIAAEIVVQAGAVPDWVVVPVGGGATLAGIWSGFAELRSEGRIAAVPRMVAVQARAFNTLEDALERGLSTAAELAAIARNERIPTVLRNLKHGVPPDGVDALKALRASRGLAVSVTDDEALAWQRLMAGEDGILCEPSSAVVGPAIARLCADRRIAESAHVVAIVTGAGVREPGVLADLDIMATAPDTGPADLARLLA